MRKKTFFISIFLFSILLLCLYTTVNDSVKASQLTTIWTEKAHYNPGETVNINGSFFQPSSTITLKVYTPDGALDATWTTTADSLGNFTTTYYLAGAEGIFKITATDSNGNTATTTFDDALSLTYDFYGWDVTSQSWTKGNLAGWKEGDLVNYKLVIGTSGSGTTVPLGSSLKIGYSFYETGAQGKNGTLVDYIQNFQWGTADFSTQSPTGYTTFTPLELSTPVTTPDTCDTPSPDRYFNLAPGSASTGIPGSLNSGSTLVIYYEAHLARTIIWQNALEKYFPQITSQISWASTATCSHGGASFFPGSSAHFYIDEPNLGNKAIPIPVPPVPAGSISGHKYNDINVNGAFNSGVDQPLLGWPINLTGTVDGISISFATTTDANGLYTFNVLTDGTWTVKEGNLTGWVASPGTQTSIPVTLPLPSGSPYGIAGSRIATNVDFFNYQPAIIIVDKVTNPSEATQSFNFNASGSNSYAAIFSLTDTTTPWNSGPLIPGSYAVSETVPSGWDLTSVTVNGTVSTNGASFTVGSGEVIVVNFTDTQRAKIITDKITNPSGSSQSFNFSTTGTGYMNFSLTDASTPNDSGWLLPGTYTVTETLPTGWNLTSVTKNGATFTNGGSITLSPGDIVYVNFTDTQQCKIIVDKITNPSGASQSFSFATTGTGYTSFSLTDTDTPNDSGFLAPGTYTVTETTPTGWALTAVTKNGTPFTNGGNIDLNAGDIVYVNFTNTQQAKIIVDKITNPTGSLQSFNFATTGTGYSSFSLTDADTPNDSGYLAPGTYTVTETLPAGWTLTSVTKNATGFSDGGNIILNAGDIVYINYTNTQQAKIIVDKVTNPSGSSQSFVYTTTGTGYAGFSLTDTAAPNDSGYLAPGTYTVTETLPTGWTLTSVTKNGTTFTDGDNIILNAGDIVYLNYTNTQQAKIIVDKITNPASSPQSFNFSTTGTGYASFSLTDAATPNDSGFLAPGTYTVTEVTPTGWALTDVTKNGTTFNNGGSITLNAGDIVFLNFTNTQQAKIIVDKITNPSGSPQSFAFTTIGTGYSSFNLADQDPPNDSGFLAPGTYSVAETVPVGWTLTTVTNNGTTINNNDNIVLNAGDIVYVNFTNTQQSKIIVDKITNPAGSSQSFVFSTTGTGYSGFSLTDTDTPNDSGYLAPGTYTVAETVPTGWNLSSVTKNGNSFSNGGSIVLGAGETVCVNFTNTQLAKIIVDKITNPSGSIVSFNFTANGAGYSSFSLADTDTPNDSGYLAPGTYSITEAVPTGWKLTSVTKNGTAFTNGGSIALNAGDIVYINFTDTQQAKIIVDKATDPPASPQSFTFNANGPNSYSATFSLTDTAAPWNSGFLVPGSGYTITETVPAGWELVSVFVNGTSSANGASLTLNPGDTLVVNFTDKQLARFVKEFSGSGALPGYTAPTISPDHISTYVNATKTGPAIWWTITYTVTNKDTVGHDYIVWDKWGGNLMVLNSTPTQFIASGKGTGSLKLSNGNGFNINYAGYTGYVGTGLVFTSTISEGLGTSQGTAYVTLHTGDQQQGTNPGGGKGTSKDGSSYDLDVRWEIGYLGAGQTATFTIIVAPGMNPGGVREFTSTGTNIINTGPVVRVYSDTSYSNTAFLYTVPDTNVLTVYVVNPKPSWA